MQMVKYISIVTPRIEDGNPSLDNIDSDEEYEVVSDRFDELLDEAEFDAMDN